MRKRLWCAGVFAGLLLAVGLVVGRGAHRTEASATRASGVSPSARPRGPSQPLAPRPSGALHIQGVVRDDQGPVAGARVSATRPEPGQTLSELPCPQDVLDRQSEPVPGTPGLRACMEEAATQVVELVRAREGEAPVYAETTTAQDGTFVLDALPEGAFALWVQGTRGALMRTGVPAGTEGLELRLDRGPMMEGIVTGEDGQTPVPGALVTALHLRHTRFFDARTGADGRFRLDPLPYAPYATVILADGWLPAFVPGTHPPTRDTPVRLFRPRRLTGRVLAPGGAPAPGVEVRVEASREDAGRWTQATTTDSAGRFTFASQPPGTQTVSASRDGLHAFASLELGENPTPEVVLTLGEALFARGTVRDTEGRPVAGARVSASLAGPYAHHLHAVTGPEGRYALGPLAPGSPEFSIESNGYIDPDPEKRRVDVDAGPVDFTLEPAVSVEGTVRDPQGRLLADIPLKLRWQNGIEHLREPLDVSRSDEAGHFVLDAPAADEVRIEIETDDFVPLRLPVQAPARDVQVVLHRGASVMGTVLDPRGVPLGGAAVALWEADGTSRAVRRERANDEGRFTVRGVKAGRYAVEATLQRASVERTASQTVELKEDATAEVSLRFEEGMTLSGVVVDGAGQPLPSARVRAGLATESLPAWRRKGLSNTGADSLGELSDAEGRFTLRNLVSGNYFLFVKKPGYGFASERSRGGEPRGDALHVDAKAKDVRLVMERYGRIHARLVGPDGAPLPEFSVNQHEMKARDGTFELPFTESGVEQLELSAPGLALLVREVEVREGVDVDLGTVRLEAGRPVHGRVVDAETSAPVADAWVDLFLSPTEPDGEARLLGDTLRTDENGAFTFPAVGRQPLTLGVIAAGYLNQSMTLAPDVETVTVRMDPGARVEVTVRDAEGRPQDGSVSFIGSEGSEDVDTEEGTAVMRGLPPGEYTVQVLADAKPPVPVYPIQRVRVPARGRLALRFTPRSGGATVVLHAESPADLLLLLVPGDAPLPTEAGGLSELISSRHPFDGTSRSGRDQTFRNVPPGRFTVFLVMQGPDWRIHREVLDVPASGTVTRDVRPVWQPFRP